MNRRSPNTGAAALYEHDVRVAADPIAIERVSPCPICSAETAVRRFEVEAMEEKVIVCTGCGLGHFHPMPNSDRLRAFYPEEYYGEPGWKFQPLIEGLVRAVGERHTSFLCRELTSGARILDVGCGRGVILGALAERGFEAHGLEISAEAVRGVDQRAEIRIAENLKDELERRRVPNRELRSGHHLACTRTRKRPRWHAAGGPSDLEARRSLGRRGPEFFESPGALHRRGLVPPRSPAPRLSLSAFRVAAATDPNRFPRAVGSSLLAAPESFRLDPEPDELLRVAPAQRSLRTSAPPCC